MTDHLRVVIGLALIAVSLGAAIIRPFGMTEAAVALPAAGIAWLTGVTTAHDVSQSLGSMAPTVLFLAAILVFGHLCAAEGVFGYLGGVVAHASNRSGPRLLVLVVMLAAAITATLTLDATVVLVTPVVLATAERLKVRPRPYAYACAHIANSGSLLLPVSNLTNLLVFSASGLSFGRFAAAMALPWLVACAIDWLTLRLAFRHEVAHPADQPPALPAVPRFGLAVLVLTVLGFVVTTALDIAPAWAAVGGCIVFAVPLLRRRRVTVRQLVNESSPGFCLFVLALGVLVKGTLDSGLDASVRSLVPSRTDLTAILVLAFLAAALANVVNNLPATLALLPFVAHSPLAVLAVLVGVNVGPNATYAGSLATLLWRRTLPDGVKPRAVEFHRIGLLATPMAVAVTTAALWLAAPLTGLR